MFKAKSFDFISKNSKLSHWAREKMFNQALTHVQHTTAHEERKAQVGGTGLSSSQMNINFNDNEVTNYL